MYALHVTFNFLPIWWIVCVEFQVCTFSGFVKRSNFFSFVKLILSPSTLECFLKVGTGSKIVISKDSFLSISLIRSFSPLRIYFFFIPFEWSHPRTRWKKGRNPFFRRQKRFRMKSSSRRTVFSHCTRIALVLHIP